MIYIVARAIDINIHCFILDRGQGGRGYKGEEEDLWMRTTLETNRAKNNKSLYLYVTIRE